MELSKTNSDINATLPSSVRHWCWGGGNCV